MIPPNRLAAIGNIAFSAMDHADVVALAQAAQPVDLASEKTLCGFGEPFEWVYFPVTCVISMLLEFTDGRQVEIRSVGNENVVGLIASISAVPGTTAARVQTAGTAVMIASEVIRARARTSPAFMSLALRFAHANLSQTERTVACRALHPLSARLARWLLNSQDRVGSNRMTLNQDYMGVMTGALRSSVSLAASDYKRAGLIRYSRGHVEVLDRKGLEQRACECYRMDLADRMRLQEPAPS